MTSNILSSIFRESSPVVDLWVQIFKMEGMECRRPAQTKKLVLEILLETKEKESLLFKSKDRSLMWTTPASK